MFGTSDFAGNVQLKIPASGARAIGIERTTYRAFESA
jgi:hypothetical protein